MKIHEGGRESKRSRVEVGVERKEEGKGRERGIKRHKERRTERCSKFVQFILSFLNA